MFADKLEEEEYWDTVARHLDAWQREEYSRPEYVEAIKAAYSAYGADDTMSWSTLEAFCKEYSHYEDAYNALELSNMRSAAAIFANDFGRNAAYADRPWVGDVAFWGVMNIFDTQVFDDNGMPTMAAAFVMGVEEWLQDNLAIDMEDYREAEDDWYWSAFMYGGCGSDIPEDMREWVYRAWREHAGEADTYLTFTTEDMWECLERAYELRAEFGVSACERRRELQAA